MKAYKATNNGKCRNITFEVGKTYTFIGQLIMCLQGFHFCKNLINVFGYYHPFPQTKIMEIEVLGDVITEGDKSITNKFKVLRFLDASELPLTIGENNTIHLKTDRFQESYQYDKNNNLIHYCYCSGSGNSNDHEFWQTFDQNNNLIHHKNSNNYQEWYEYDEKNNLTYVESSSGVKTWKKYDQNNNLVNVKNSHGFQEWFTYDERNNLIHIKNEHDREEWYEYDQNNNLTHFKDSNGVEYCHSTTD